MQSTKNFTTYLCAVVWTLQRILTVAAQTPAPATEQTNILWSLSPCQSAFWVPSIPSEFNQNWITYQYEGNPLSQAGECIFTLESDPNTKIEMTVTQVQLFGNALTVPPPCLELYDVKMDGSIVLLQKECNVFLAFNQFESFPTFTETNLAVISTTIRYGSFQLRARAVPKNFGFPNKVSSTTVNNIAVDTIPTVVPTGPVMTPTTTKGQTGSTKPTLGLPPTTKPISGSNTSTMPSVEIITPMPVNSSAGLQPELFH